MNKVWFNDCLRWYLIFALILIFVGGCSNKFSPEVRQERADSYAISGGLTQEKIQTDSFLLTTYQRFNRKDKDRKLVVYIEGDGMAWVSRNQLSTNPTPVHPVALELASLDDSANILYIARPCQYLWLKNTNGCNSKYWSNKRGSEEVIDAINQVISIVKDKENMLSIKLIGYSGGGGIAAIITKRRDDVKKLITVAGNLNYKLFAKIHKITSMNGSINPVIVAKQIESIPQVHYVGSDDRIVPEQIVRSFSDKVVVVSGATHTNWAEKWEMLLESSYKK